MDIVQLSYLKLLEEISEKLGIDSPQCDVTLVGGRWFLAQISFVVVHPGSIIETHDCWGGPSLDIEDAMEEAGCSAIRKMKSIFVFEVKDINYDDYILYRDIYNQVMIQYTNLLTDFNNLKREYNTLENSYVAALAHNEDLVVKQEQMRSKITEYHATLNRLHRGCSVSSADPSDDSFNS